MGIKDKIKLHFSRFFDGGASSSTNVAASKAISSDLVGYIVKLSNFPNMKDEDVYEQLYVWEPEIGGGIDRIGTLSRQAFQGFCVKDVGNTLEPSEVEMVRLAEEISEQQGIPNYWEMLSELLICQGNIFIVENKDLSLTVLPNKYCNLVDDKKKVGNGSNTIMMQPNYLAFNEMSSSELDSQIYDKGDFYQIKYKDTPLFITDSMGRSTYGFYSVSPLQRTVLSVWWKRQCMIIDVLLRWRNVPREFHQIKADMFPLSNYPGKNPAEKQAAAQKDIESFIAKYAEALQSQMPDQGVIATNNVDIKMIESKVNYLQSNELIDQLNHTITAGLNIPQSIINGQDAGSFASELVISNYVSAKIVQIAERIKPVILANMRKRILAIDSSLPVDRLDIKLELSLANSKLELWRTVAIMASLGVFTDSEIRDVVGYEPLRDDQMERLVSKTGVNSSEAVANAMKGGDAQGADYPDTASSDSAHTRDDGQNAFRGT